MVRATRQAVRRAFTLTEMLVVVLIITVLLGIILPAIQNVKLRAQILQAQNDISQLSTGIENFKSTYNVAFLPSSFSLQGTYTLSTPVDAAYANYLKQVWPRLSGFSSTTLTTNFNNLMTGGATQLALNGNQCLVFFLGGYVAVTSGSTTQPVTLGGFSPSSSSPFVPSSSNANARTGPFFEFPKARLSGSVPADGSTSQFLSFNDPWGNPYVYFTSMLGNDYSPTQATNGSSTNPSGAPKTDGSDALNWIHANSPVVPFQETATPVIRFYKANSFQIVSAGPNKRIEKGGLMTPGSGQYIKGLAGGDDLSNFWPRELGTP